MLHCALDGVLLHENGLRITPSELLVECMRNGVTRQRSLDLAADKLRAYFKENGQYLSLRGSVRHQHGLSMLTIPL